MGEPNHPRARIFCVDDEPYVLHVLTTMLERDNFTVESTTDSAVAWQKLSADLGGFELVITDNEMPGLTGAALVQRLRTEGFRGHIMMFCGRKPENLTELPIDAFVPKGCGPLELMNVIRRLMRRP